MTEESPNEPLVSSRWFRFRFFVVVVHFFIYSFIFFFVCKFKILWDLRFFKILWDFFVLFPFVCLFVFLHTSLPALSSPSPPPSPPAPPPTLYNHACSFYKNDCNPLHAVVLQVTINTSSPFISNNAIGFIQTRHLNKRWNKHLQFQSMF